MTRFAMCVVLIAGLASLAGADEASGPRQQAAEETSPAVPQRSVFVVEVTRLVVDADTGVSAAGLHGEQLEEQIGQWRRADKITSTESLSLTCVEDYESTLQFGQEVPLKTGTTSLRDGRTVATSTTHSVGTLMRTTVARKDPGISVSITYEASRVAPPAGEESFGGIETTTVSTHLMVKDGEPNVVAAKQEKYLEMYYLVVRAVAGPGGRSTAGEQAAGERSRRPSAGGSFRRRPPGASPYTGRPLSSSMTAESRKRFEAMARTIMQRYDKNDDRAIDAQEGERLRSFKEMDGDDDGKITLDEFVEYHVQRIFQRE